MTHAARLRPATAADAPACAAILRRWIEETPWFPDRHPAAADTPFIAEKIARGEVTVAGNIDGFLAREGSYVSCLYVDRGARSQGLGAALLDAAKREAARLTLWTFVLNEAAQRFYLREGFVELQRTDGAGNDEGLPDIEYGWRREGQA